MKRTLLAVGVAVLVAMLLAPHGDKNGVQGFGPFFSNYGFRAAGTGCGCSGWIGTFSCYAEVGRVMIDMLVLQTLFLVVLFVVIVNLFPHRQRK